MYLPVYSSNGWEIGQDKYNEKRFVITFSKILINLFNRKVLIEALILFHYVILDLKQLISEYLNYRYI
jgi:hypothetical protein